MSMFIGIEDRRRFIGSGGRGRFIGTGFVVGSMNSSGGRTSFVVACCNNWHSRIVSRKVGS